MALWFQVSSLIICIILMPQAQTFLSFFSDTDLNHLAVNNDTGIVYIGAVNRLYQLSAELDMQVNFTTGPKLDKKSCTPPIDSQQCPSAEITDNYNKLLLLDKPHERIIVCGSIFKGICSLRAMSDISTELWYKDNLGEKSFVASNDEVISTVGLVTNHGKEKRRLLFVGKGHVQNDNGIIISTRILEKKEDRDVFEVYQDSATFKSVDHIKHFQQFVTAFENDDYVYFVSTRADRISNENRTFISRLCKDDFNYYSYIEMPLECKNQRNNESYNFSHSVFVTKPGSDLADIMKLPSTETTVLFGVFSRKQVSDQSAVCVFSLSEINNKFEENREACYTSNKADLKTLFFKPYGGELSCANSPSGAAKSYRCGSEHLPYPLECKEGVSKSSVLIREKNPFSSVAIAVENEHTIAFLGTAEGKLVKAFIRDQSYEYRNLSFETSSAVKNGMVFDADQKHLYVMTKKKAYRVPVQDCARSSNCNECISTNDPYCGWCVLEGKCTRKVDCPRNNNSHWLFSPSGTCMQVKSATPGNMSVMSLRKVTLTVEPSIYLLYNDNLICDFGGAKTTAELQQDGTISCQPPNLIPSPEKGKDNVNITINLSFQKNGDVFFANYSYPFYNCKEAINLSENMPCTSCVTSRWNCQWDINNHRCEDSSQRDDVIEPNMEENCPQFYEPNPSLIPMKHKSTITFNGKNLDHYKNEDFSAGSDEFTFKTDVLQIDGSFSLSIPEFPAEDKETVPLGIYIKVNEKKIDSKLNVNLYNCMYGRSDCSLCLAADPVYQCVWCNDKCVYKDMCEESPATECPAPKITDLVPIAAPLKGGIRLTIKGSNLGIKPADVEEIIVANTPCTFIEELYSVSTSVVCEVGAVDEPDSGNVKIKIKEKMGISSQIFTYQDPNPDYLHPLEGIMAGGTRLTIKGQRLETGSENDIRVTLDSIPCAVKSFGEEIVCDTGMASKKGEVAVKLLYGDRTEINAGHFIYKENPSIAHFTPDRSFASGGRHITISGSGFNLVQNFRIIARLQGEDSSSVTEDESKTISQEDILEKVNDSVIIFTSPQVPENYLTSGVTIVIKMDGLESPLQTNELSFLYIPDPTFENFTDGIKKQVNNLINAKGDNLNAAMTIEEAKAFVGEGTCKINTLTSTDLYCVPPEEQPPPKRRHKRDTANNLPEFIVKFGKREWVLGKVEYGQSPAIPLHIIIPVVIIPMLLIIGIAVYFYRRKSQQAEREYEKVKLQLEGLEETVRERCKREFTELMIEMEDQTSDLSEAGIPFLDYKTYTDRVFFLSSKDGEKDVMITGKLDIPEARRQTVEVALNQFSNLLNSKSFLTIFIHTLESQKDFSAREKLYLASLLTVALHGKLEYYTDIMRALLMELMDQYVAKNPKLLLRRSETVVERMLSNWMSICLYQYLKDTVGEPLYKLFKAIKHQVEKGPVDALQAKAKYTLNDTGLLGDDVEYKQLTVNVIVQEEGAEPVPVKVLNCDTITQVKEKIVDQVYRNIPYSLRPKADSLALEWRPGSTAQILSDLDLTSQKEGRLKRYNTLMHYNVRDNATLILSRMGISQQQEENHQDFPGERNALLEDENKAWHLVRPADEVDEVKSKRGSMKEKERTKAITEIYLTRLLSVKGTLQQFVDNFFQSVLNSNQVVPPAVKYFFDFLDEQAEKYEIKDEDTVHIWKTNSLSLRFWVNILKNPHFIFDVHVHQVVDASLSVIAQTFMDACSRTEHKLSRESPSNKLLYAKEISTYKKMVEDYYKGIRQMVQVSDQDMNTHLAEISRAHTESLNTLVALHQLYQYTNKYYDEIINALEEDPAAQRMQLAYRLQQIAAALENKVTDL
ncbi:plexin-B2 precursor [Xenopus tropicalis]|uniref:Plexin-B2 precursor n=1 Tax=Xenopus tropicalis TaxID=8364 RepID=A0A8J0PJH0_XENTR|eukprot:XP_017947604.1 PREDICTED: plexin-B2 isoform X1 [Xenopus tropicalis]